MGARRHSGPRASRARGRSEFGEQLYRLRRAAGLTQDELAWRAGVHRRVVEAAERELAHHPMKRTIEALERGLEQPGCLRVGPCSVCGGEAQVGRTWCEGCAPGTRRSA